MKTVSTTFVYMEYAMVDKAMQASDQGSKKQRGWFVGYLQWHNELLQLGV